MTLRVRHQSVAAFVLFAALTLVEDCGGHPSSPSGPSSIAAGSWGGDHIAITIGPTEATVELDCAHGTMLAPIPLNAHGQFDVAGVFVREHGGPVRPDEPPDSHPARYAGSTDGQVLTLTITLTDGGELIGTYQAVLGRAPRVFKCV